MKHDFNINQVMNASSYRDMESLGKHFNNIADLMMNNIILHAGKNEYRFTEIEFYFFKPGLHEDPFIHKHDLQLLTGHWYFHGSGLDITFGDGRNHGGILVRGFQRVTGEESEFISGPLNVVQEIFKSFENIQVKEHKFYLDEVFDLQEEKIIKSTRTGLSGNKSEEFKNKLYRYLIFPYDSRHKYAEKTKVAEAILTAGTSKSEINEGFKWKILK